MVRGLSSCCSILNEEHRWKLIKVKRRFFVIDIIVIRNTGGRYCDWTSRRWCCYSDSYSCFDSYVGRCGAGTLHAHARNRRSIHNKWGCTTVVCMNTRLLPPYLTRQRHTRCIRCPSRLLVVLLVSMYGLCVAWGRVSLCQVRRVRLS